MSDEIMKTPKILLFDCDNNVREALESHNFFIKEATFGRNMKVEHSIERDTFVNLNHYYPENIHEFDIIIIDMDGVKLSEKINEIAPENKNKYLFEIEYPNKLFYTSALTPRVISREFPSSCIYIVFASEKIEVEYSYYEVKEDGVHYGGTGEGCNFDFIQSISGYNPYNIRSKNGKQTKLIGDDPLSKILKKYNNYFHYSATFDGIGTILDAVALLKNKDEETISFLSDNKGVLLLVLPQLDNKKDLLIDILNKYLPEVVSEIFPYFTQFDWIKDKNYLLPNENEYWREIEKIKNEFEEKKKQIKEKIEKNKGEYRFLHDMLIETGKPLVRAVMKYLEWVGFEHIIDVDEEDGKLKEDIRIIEDRNILIIEVKGLGGTSSDSDCAQIGKHRRGLEKKNKDCEISPLYIVNHQRFMPPLNRENPPFTKDQIDYANGDERGLLTTFQLFKWYKMNKDELITKDEIRRQFYKIGNIPLLPENYQYINKIKKYYPEKNAFVIETSSRLEVGDKLVFIQEIDGFIIMLPVVKTTCSKKQVKSFPSFLF